MTPSSFVRGLLGLVASLGIAEADSCSFDPATDSVKCSVQTLTNHNTSLDVNRPFRSLSLECLDHLEESVLRSNHFGQLPSLRTLRIQDCKVRHIPDNAFSGLSGLRHLSVRTNNWPQLVMEVRPASFDGLHDLQTLNLTHNSLWSMPRGVLCVLRGLTSLNLSGNSLQDVTELGFGSSEARSCRLPLRRLDLSGNSLSSLPDGCFGQLTADLEHLDVSANKLSVIEDNALDGLTGLRSLNLAGNRLIALPPDMFRSAKTIQQLFLQNNSISVLAPGIFSELEQLLVLNLSRNSITNDWLTPNTFAKMFRLVALDLSHNQLTKLDQSLLNGLTSLQILDLQHNRLHSVTGNTFLSQHNLHVLRLSHNLIADLHHEAMAGLSVLSSLELNHNRISRLHSDLLRGCPNLVDLSLSHNLLTAVPSISHVTGLDLGYNLLKSISNTTFAGVDQLTALSLAGNGIRSLDPTVFESLTRLQVLNLAENKLAELDQGVFKPLGQLRILRLDGNRLKDINGLLASQTELRMLNISDNQLQWFDYAFIPKKLEWLDIHGNQIEELGNYYKLQGEFSLTTLDASDNRMAELKPLSLPASLQTARLGKNNIRRIAPGTFQNKTLLDHVDLRGNELRQLEISALSVGSTEETGGFVPEFLLSDNPFLCDCEMEWLKQINTMRSGYPRVADLDRVQCQLNNNHFNNGSTAPFPIADIPSEQFVCPYQAHCFALCLCCDFFACDCRMQCPQGCACYHDSTWTANVIQCSYRGHSEIPPLIPMDATAVFLDGNNFTGILESSSFIGRKRVKSLYLNSSLIEAVSNQTFNGLTELEILHLEDNRITRLFGHEFVNLTSLRELHLQNNALESISDDAFSPLVSLEILHLFGNRLTSLPVWRFDVLLPSLRELTLSDNPWTCRCDFVHKFQSFARDTSTELLDMNHIQCVGASSRLFLSRNVTCSGALAVTSARTINLLVIPIAVTILAVCIVVAVVSIVLFVFRTPFRVWLHSKYGIRVLNTSKSSCVYDAFVSYSQKDDEFIQQILVPQLEQQDDGHYKLLLQHRDLPKSSSIADTFPSLSQLCSKQILLVSRAYLDSEWSQIKFALPDSKQWKPVIVMLEDLSSLDLAAVPEFNFLLKTSPVVRWNDAGFWNKLRFYLPDARKSGPRRNFSAPLHKPLQHPLWAQDPFLQSSNSSSLTRSTVTSGSPRNTSTESRGADEPHLISNPLEVRSNWWDPGFRDASRDHTYHTIRSTPAPSEPIYHTLEPEQFGGYDTLGKLDVMLPNGQMVPATLVRNLHGEIVPLVEVKDSRTMPRS